MKRMKLKVKVQHRLTSLCTVLSTLVAAALPSFAHAIPTPKATPAPKTLGAEKTAPIIMPDRKPASRDVTKAELIARLRTLQNRQNTEIQALEDAAKKRLKAAASTDFKSEMKFADHQLNKLTEQIGSIDSRRSELLARRIFINQLILLIDSKWSNQKAQPLQQFLERQLLDMAANDLSNPEGSSQTWKFATYLSVAIREVPEDGEDLLGIVEGYMNYASVLNPKSPVDYMDSRNYSNGTESATARSFERSELGDFAEARLRETEALRGGKHPAKSDIELRMKVIPPPPAAVPAETPAEVAPSSASPAADPANGQTPAPAVMPPAANA